MKHSFLFNRLGYSPNAPITDRQLRPADAAREQNKPLFDFAIRQVFSNPNLDTYQYVKAADVSYGALKIQFYALTGGRGRFTEIFRSGDVKERHSYRFKKRGLRLGSGTFSLYALCQSVDVFPF